MKEGINFAPISRKRAFPLERLALLSRENQPPFKLGLALSVLIFSLLAANLILAVVQKKYADQEAQLRQSLSNLKQKEEIVLSVVQKQKDLEFIKTQKKDFSPQINLVKDHLPEETVLTFLGVNEEKIKISAQTPTGLSFSQFIANLIGAKLCQQISLTKSLYVQKEDSFSFSLECLLKN